MPQSNWTPETTNPTEYTSESINPVIWGIGEPLSEFYLLLQTGGTNGLLLQNGTNFIGLTD